jgi:Uma2 family endonuclease
VILIRPDWVAEVLSTSNAGNDLVKKLRTLHRHGVPHYWIVDPEHRTLTVMRWTPDGYLTALTAEEHDVVRAEPFDAIDLHVAMLFGGQDDEQGAPYPWTQPEDPRTQPECPRTQPEGGA